MRIFENGFIRDMTPEEIATLQEARARAGAEEKHRPLSQEEVTTMLLRQQINTLAVDDAMAYRMRDFYPEWAEGQSYTVGQKLLYGGSLYKVTQAHTSQAGWKPGVGTESLFTRIDETHDGTKYDPIPYNGNMELLSGKYYTQSGQTYHCTRDTGTAVFHPLAELVGIYVEVMEV